MPSQTSTSTGLVRVRGGSGKGLRGRAARDAKRDLAEEKNLRREQARQARVYRRRKAAEAASDRAVEMLTGISSAPVRMTPIRRTADDARVATILAGVKPIGAHGAKRAYEEARRLLIEAGFTGREAANLIRDHRNTLAPAADLAAA